LLIAPSLAADLADANRSSVLVVGAYHFVSKADLVNMEVDDPMSPARQAQIKVLVDRLMAFHPTKVVLEQTLLIVLEAGIIAANQSVAIVSIATEVRVGGDLEACRSSSR
jgi:hypothetical protein